MRDQHPRRRADLLRRRDATCRALEVRMTSVTVFRDKYAKGWPRHEQGERAHVLELGAALDREYSTDAHFAAYRTPNGRRLVREAIDQGVAIELTAIVFDVDGAAHAATPEWRRGERDKVISLNSTHPGVYAYDTRGGYRLVYRQSEPTILRSQDDSKEWSQIYSVAVAHLERRFGIVADPACCDWQRLYRLPRATRTPGAGPENHPYWGDHRAIGTLLIEASWADVNKAKREAPNAFKVPRSFTPYAGSGDGVVYWLLRLRGDIIGDASRGGWICRCPNRVQHTSCTDGSDSTVVYAPRSEAEIGVVVCKHAHCIGFEQRDWLRFFTDAEIERAREAAGVTEGRAA
jgi:hypothetical protein